MKTFGAGAGIGALMSMFPGFAESKSVRDCFTASGRPKGIIFLVGDGMPLGVTRAMHEIVTRVYGRTGSSLYSVMRDPLTAAGYMGTGSLSSIVTDSAPASAAWSTGSHTANGMLATLPDGTPLKTIMEILKERGVSTGLVTTTRITHATPAAWVSHQIDRDAEDAIALDYLGFMPDVLLGGGSRYFDPARRSDRRDLFAEFAAAGYHVLRDRTSLKDYAKGSPSARKLLGLFHSSHMSYYVDRVNDPVRGNAEPGLADMAAVALNTVSRNRKGFILQVEAGRIDHASHANDAWSAIMDTIEMDMTLKVILGYMKKNPNTLLIITSDHGNSGWGVNGTGPSYNDATMALQKYAPVKASFEVIVPQLRNKTASEIKGIISQYTTFGDLTDAEAQMIYDSVQSGYKPYPGDFSYLAETVLGKVLSHSDYTATPQIRRGNVGFTSNNHTAEDQIALIYGKKARHLGVAGYVDNTDLFRVMCNFFNVTYSNPKMTSKAARPYIKVVSHDQWQRHLRLHVS
jgi:alkaline phosphatase